MAEIHPAAGKLLERMAEAKNPPVCILDIAREGGATYYSMRRMEEFLAHGRGVARFTCNRNGSLDGAAHYRGLSIPFSLPGIQALRETPMPRFRAILVNELVSWTLPQHEWEHHTPNGTGAPRWIPAILRIVADLAALWGARLDFAVHDYFPVCPNFVLLRGEAEQRYCGVPDMAGCGACLAQPAMRGAFGESFSLTAWREAWDVFLAAADRIICPSESGRDILLRAFTAKGKRLVVIPHAPLVPAGGKLVLPGKDVPMHVAVVGRITIPKGAEIVRDIALLMRAQGLRERVTIVGTLAAPGVALPEDVRVTGPYEKEKLGDALRDIGATVGLIPSVWPETFNYVCQELMRLELPSVSFDLGAPAERIRVWEHGLVANAVGAAPALETLRRLDARRRSGASALQ